MLTNQELLKVVATMVKRQNIIKMCFGLAFLLLGTTLLLFLKPPIHSVVKVIIAILILGSISLIYNYVKKRKIERNKEFRILKYHLKEIVWVHHHITQVMPFGIHLFERYNLYIYLLNGKSYQLIGTKEEVLFLMHRIPSLAHQASFGYSIEKEQLFKANPALLLQED